MATFFVFVFGGAIIGFIWGWRRTARATAFAAATIKDPDEIAKIYGMRMGTCVTHAIPGAILGLLAWGSWQVLMFLKP